MPKVPVTYLGVETSEVPRVLSEQLGLAKGFGLVVDYVVPDSPAAAAGVQQNDIIKMLNDQILTDPEQYAQRFAQGSGAKDHSETREKGDPAAFGVRPWSALAFNG
jgi:S1-C subfamily serine protease